MPPSDVNAAWMMVAAFEKLVAALSVIVVDVLSVPSMVTARMPDSACNCVSVTAAMDPPRT
ncbi:hypothetical protein D3C71_1976360 [compost metagenome]